MAKKKTDQDVLFSLGEQLKLRVEGRVISPEGRLNFEEAGNFTLLVPRIIRGRKLRHVQISLADIKQIDSAGVMALYHVQRTMARRRISVELVNTPVSVEEKMLLFTTKDQLPERLTVQGGFLERTGEVVHHFFSSYIFGFLLLASNIFYWSFADLFRSSARRKGEVVNQSVLIGVNAVPIVVFLSFVIGFVIALQSSGQLKSFGANIFVVDLVVISIMSQMGPLITAILIAGRSGSAIAAEIATMKVTAELDALKTMGLNPNRFVIVPKLYACMLTMPFLIVLANVAGMTGGGLAANLYLDITPEIFMNRMGDIMRNKDLFTALIKSQVYAALIVLTGSFYGLRVERGAEGVGRVTTVAVVVSITLVILADSILGIVFY